MSEQQSYKMSCHSFLVSSCISNMAKCLIACLDLVSVLACEIKVPEKNHHSQKWEIVLTESILNIFVFKNIFPFYSVRQLKSQFLQGK